MRKIIGQTQKKTKKRSLLAKLSYWLFFMSFLLNLHKIEDVEHFISILA
jgi:hypothetical protein